jgi:hypothetical protein
VRFRRAEERRRIYALSMGDGCVELAELLEAAPWWLEGAMIGDVLQWPRSMGRTMMRRAITSACRCTEANPDALELRKVRELTERQRGLLCKWLRDHHGYVGQR